MMSSPRNAFDSGGARLLEIVEAARLSEVEFSDWCIASPDGGPTVFGHLQVANRRGVTRILEALLDVDATVDLDISPCPDDDHGRWSVWVRSSRSW